MYKILFVLLFIAIVGSASSAIAQEPTQIRLYVSDWDTRSGISGLAVSWKFQDGTVVEEVLNNGWTSWVTLEAGEKVQVRLELNGWVVNHLGQHSGNTTWRYTTGLEDLYGAVLGTDGGYQVEYIDLTHVSPVTYVWFCNSGVAWRVPGGAGNTMTTDPPCIGNQVYRVTVGANSREFTSWAAALASIPVNRDSRIEHIWQ